MADLVLVDRVRTVRLYGALGQLFGRSHGLVVSSPKDAIRALCSLLDGFEKFITESRDRGLTFGVFNGRRNLSKEELGHAALGDEEIRIAPIIQGNKRAGLLQTIVGVVLIAASYFGAPTFAAGLAMLAGGVAAMLAPQTKGLAAADEVTNRPSYAFNGPVNTAAQGNAIPVLYGELVVGSAVISAGIFAEDQL
jgi:predicted phage tail protein